MCEWDKEQRRRDGEKQTLHSELPSSTNISHLPWKGALPFPLQAWPRAHDLLIWDTKVCHSCLKGQTLPCDLYLRSETPNTHLPIHTYNQDQHMARPYLRPILLQLSPLPYPASITPLKVFTEEQCFNKSHTQKSLSQALRLKKLDLK